VDVTGSEERVAAMEATGFLSFLAFLSRATRVFEFVIRRSVEDVKLSKREVKKNRSVKRKKKE
jgi:hypothetical protein